MAVPKLRLTSSTVGPIAIAVGANGAQQRVEAYNAEDGALALSATTTDEWLAPAVGALGPCTSRGGNCFPINIALNTAGLAKGIYTGTVVVADPNAWDAPQRITVTVQMGGAVPDAVNFFVAPNGGSDQLDFTTGSQLQAAVTTQSGGNWLSLALDAGGTFQFLFPYHLKALHGGQAEGTYNGSLNVTGSAFPPDVKNVPVSMRVTSEPIGLAVPPMVELRSALTAAAPSAYVSILNRGTGTLGITGAVAAAANGGSWLTAAKLDNLDIIQVTANLEGLAPGVYRGTVTVSSNAANGALVIPVVLRLAAAGRPESDFGGAVNNALYDQPIGLGGIGALFGGLFSFQAPVHGVSIPLSRELGGAKVYLNGMEAPLYDSLFGQINFQVPFEVQPGEASLQVVRDGVLGNVITVQVAARAPRILLLGIGNYGILVNQDGTFPIPPTPGIPSRRAKAGDVLVGYGIGFGQTDPPLTTGAPATVASYIVPEPTAYFGSGFLGGVAVNPDYVGITPDPNLVGLYQFNLTVPLLTNKGDNVLFRLEGPGFMSNTVELAIE